MGSTVIRSIATQDRRFALAPGAGGDAIHRDPYYAYAVALLNTDAGPRGTGFALTLGPGTPLVCQAIDLLAAPLVGREIEELMASFGQTFNALANHPQLRWLGPHKGVVQLALAAITNACFDLWAKARGLPLWRLLLDLTPEQITALLDLRYLDDLLTPQAATALIAEQIPSRPERSAVLRDGYPGYDTSVGWFGYSDAQVREHVRRSTAAGFGAVKLKVGSADAEHDLRRAAMVRDSVGPDVKLMLDANQQWSVPQAMRMCAQLQPLNPYWIEEPTHPDDILAHQALARAVAPMRIAVGEHIPNSVLFKNFIWRRPSRGPAYRRAPGPRACRRCRCRARRADGAVRPLPHHRQLAPRVAAPSPSTGYLER